MLAASRNCLVRLKTLAIVAEAECHFYEGISEMGNCLETTLPDQQAPLARALAYYRHSVQDGREESLLIQQDHVRQWASENGVEIIREFCDARPAEIDSADRPAFTEMLEDWIKQRSDFEYVLCLDANRWGRFPNIAIAELVSEICEHHKKQLIYTSDGKPKDNEAIKEVPA